MEPIKTVALPTQSVILVKVSAVSKPSAVAGAIAGIMRDNGKVAVQAIGAGAVNQAVKALIMAKKFLVQDDMVIAFTPDFLDVEIEDIVRTAIRFEVFQI